MITICGGWKLFFKGMAEAGLIIYGFTLPLFLLGVLTGRFTFERWLYIYCFVWACFPIAVLVSAIIIIMIDKQII